MYNLSVFLFLGFFLTFLVTGGVVALRVWQDYRDARAYEALNSLVTLPVESQVTDQTENTEPQTDPTEGGQESTRPTLPQAPAEPTVLLKYQMVYAMNQDLFGWLSIEDTAFNYPVVHTPEDEEYYLRRGFDQKYSRSGVPFLDGDCYTDCGNYLIYGHNMDNGTMFAPLLGYADEEFWKEHPRIRFDTIYEEAEYEVIAAFYSRVFYQYETNVFRFYNYPDLTDREVYSEYAERVKKAAMYDTGVDAEYPDQLLTLITCSYGGKNERFVVVARKCK